MVNSAPSQHPDSGPRPRRFHPQVLLLHLQAPFLSFTFVSRPNLLFRSSCFTRLAAGIYTFRSPLPLSGQDFFSPFSPPAFSSLVRHLLVFSPSRFRNQVLARESVILVCHEKREDERQRESSGTVRESGSSTLCSRYSIH